MQAAFTRCVTSPDEARGVIRVQVELAGDGSARSTTFDLERGSTDSAVQRCLIEKMPGIRFPPPRREGEIVTIQVHSRAAAPHRR